MASLPPSRQPMLAAVGRGNVGGPKGGPDARRWSASYSRDPVVMIVMSVRAASSELLWGWNAASERDPRALLSPFFHPAALSLAL